MLRSVGRLVLRAVPRCRCRGTVRYASVKILDFGLATFDESWRSAEELATFETAVLPVDGLLVGTICYMSPEQLRGQTVDHRTDIFTLGAIQYEMLVGERAFPGRTAAEMIAAILDIEAAAHRPRLADQRRSPAGNRRAVPREERDATFSIRRRPRIRVGTRINRVEPRDRVAVSASSGRVVRGRSNVPTRGRAIDRRCALFDEGAHGRGTGPEGVNTIPTIEVKIQPQGEADISDPPASCPFDNA